jgi:hypothetical protein
MVAKVKVVNPEEPVVMEGLMPQAVEAVLVVQVDS